RVCVEAPPFAALVQNLLIRIPMLSAIHCGEVWQEDFKALVARAGEVETVTDETTWVSFRRYSSFKRKSETLEGVVGRVEYAGPVEEFLPLLHIGQLTHAGKRAVFGLGRYRLREARASGE
ncbi:MAG: CRISPR system precrRNA processing endoribonuclease RAMP protein Cas6, partial [Rubrobacteraceae bacterium]|nr:CRISPR system precrRNA processing endoribonuclease RAMP protein Cas6 [Rubrobacteraceae bacterium]